MTNRDIASNQVRRYEGIDALKGLLITLVVIGHSSTQPIADSFVRYIIYSFHMPLFLALSGFVLKSERIRQPSLRSMLGKYGHRMLFPWGIALLAYTAMRLAAYTLVLTPSGLTEEVLYPWNHLWFIPVLFIMILIERAIDRDRPMVRTIILLGSLVMGITVLIFVKDFGQHSPLYWLGDKRIYAYFCFFNLGYLCRNSRFEVGRRMTVLLGSAVAALAAVRVYSFVDPPADWVNVLVFFGLNCALIPLAISICLRVSTPPKGLWIPMAHASLPIYLWHIMPILVLRALHIDAKWPTAYGVLIAVSVLFILAVSRWSPRYPQFARLVNGQS